MGCSALLLLLVLQDPAPPHGEALRRVLKDAAPKGAWHYDDLDGAFEEARRTGKPLMAVLRCTPCRSCRALDARIARREDPDLAALMDRFVCVRLVQGWGLDLSLFQFDWRQTWAVLLLNAERAVYARFDARHDRDVEELRSALTGALELHGRWPASRPEVLGKSGLPLPWTRPEELPALKSKGQFGPAGGSRECLHCHNVLEGLAESLRPPSVRYTARWPQPQKAGVMLAVRDGRVFLADVSAKSEAGRAGLKEGDRLLSMAGQTILSWADFSWALFSSEDGAPIPVEVERGAGRLRLELRLPEGWRTR